MRHGPVWMGMLVAATCVACATVQRRDAQQTESFLITAGFLQKPADTADKAAHLAGLKPHKLVSFTRDGQRVYAYADPTGCNCLLVGDTAAYERYRRLVDAPEIAEEQEIAATIDEEGADDAGTDWEYQNGPLWW